MAANVVKFIVILMFFSRMNEPSQCNDHICLSDDDDDARKKGSEGSSSLDEAPLVTFLPVIKFLSEEICAEEGTVGRKTEAMLESSYFATNVTRYSAGHKSR